MPLRMRVHDREPIGQLFVVSRNSSNAADCKKDFASASTTKNHARFAAGPISQTECYPQGEEYAHDQAAG